MYDDPLYIRGCYYQDIASIPILQNNKAQLIDLRQRDAFNREHIPGFMNIPYSLLLANLHLININQPVYFLCETGKKSDIIATKLCTLGYRAYSFIGGYLHYTQPTDPSLY